MRWGNLSPDGTLSWTGKARRPRTVRLGPTFAERLARWRRAYETGLGRTVGPDDPILCPMNTANQYATARRPAWGRPLGQDAYRRLLQRRADTAGLGHLAPHDLRRTTANLLNTARSADGGHLFDVADIQKVLGHAQIGTTQHYLNVLDTAAIDRAAPVLDLA